MLCVGCPVKGWSGGQGVADGQTVIDSVLVLLWKAAMPWHYRDWRATRRLPPNYKTQR